MGVPGLPFRAASFHNCHREGAPAPCLPSGNDCLLLLHAEVLSANLNCGDRVLIEAVGPDEQEALNELEALLLRFRDEEGGAQGN